MGWGGNAALFYTGEAVNIGVSYRSRVRLNIQGTAKGGSALGFAALSGVTAPVSLVITTPEMLSFSVSVRPAEHIRLSMQADWVNWSVFKQLQFQYGSSPLNAVLGTTQTEPEHWKAVTSYGLGGEWALSSRYRIRAGYSFDPTPRNPSYFSPRAIDGDRQIVSLGYGQRLLNGADMNLGLGYLWVKPIQQYTSLASQQRNGTYRLKAYILMLDYQWRF